jgi:hypothetical protein
VLLAANQKVRSIFQVETEDGRLITFTVDIRTDDAVIAHRLEVLRKSDLSDEALIMEQALTSKSRLRDVHRPHHLSQQGQPAA